VEPRWRSLRRRLTRTVARHRRALAALAAGLAALTALTALRPAPAPTTTVAVAAHDLPSGATLAPGDVGALELPTGAAPDGAYTPAEVPVGRLVAAPVRRGEPLTDAGLVGPGLADRLAPDHVLTIVEVATATTVLVRPGDVVDVVAGRMGGSGGAAAELVATGATVVAVPPAAAGSQAGSLVLAVDQAAALVVAQAALLAPLQVLVRPR
jgi:Flp pilus assembly protein CpaB